ncbi:MAG: hypothetical protein ABEJ86_08305, partial [Halococcoides sp.]
PTGRADPSVRPAGPIPTSKPRAPNSPAVYRASDQRAEADALDDLERAADRLAFDERTTSRARDLYLSHRPEAERSKPAVIATSLYVAGRTTGETRSQMRVADACDVSRFTIQRRWRDMLESAGFETPDW